MVTIEKDVPLPSGNIGARQRVVEQMAVGDSIVTSKNEATLYYYAARRMGIKLTRRKENDEYRIWRVE